MNMNATLHVIYIPEIHVYAYFAPLTVGVDLARDLEGLRGGHVGVGGRHRQDDAVGVGDVLEDQLADLQLDVLRLVAHRHLGWSDRGYCSSN